MFVAVPSVVKGLPKGCGSGDKLFGAFNVEDKDAAITGRGAKPGGHEICLIVPPKESEEEKEAKAAVKEKEDVRGEVEKLNEEVKDWKLDKLEKMIASDEKGEGKFEEVYESLVGEYGDDLRLLHIGLKVSVGRRGEAPPHVCV